MEQDKLVFKSDKCSFPLPDAWKSRAEKLDLKRRVVFGIRPESIGSPEAERNPDAPKIRSKVDVVEPMGAETFLYLDKGFIARIDPHRACAPGDEIELAMDQSKAHLFDAESGVRVI